MSNNQNGISRMSGFFTRRTNILALCAGSEFLCRYAACFWSSRQV